MNPVVFPSAQHPSQWELHRRARGLLPQTASEQVDLHVADCARCHAAVGELQAAEREFVDVVFPRTAEAVLARAGAARSWKWLSSIAFPALALGTAVVVLAPRFRGGEIAGDDLRTKGPLPGEAAVTEPRVEPELQPPAAKDEASTAVQVRVHVKRGDSVLLLNPARDVLAPDDEMRFSVTRPGGLPYLMIASIDGAGGTNIYFPFGGDESGVAPGSRPWVDVPGSIVLDESRGPERIFALHSLRPLDAATVKAALARIGRGGDQAIRGARLLDVPAQAQGTVAFEKRAR